MHIYEIKPRTLPHTAHPLLILGMNNPENQGLTGILMPKRHEMTVDYIEQPMRLVSTKMKEILCAHEPRITARAVNLYNPETNEAWQYWDFQTQRQFVFYDSLENSRATDHPIFNRSMVTHYNVFTVVGLSLDRWFISLPVLEALYRYEITGFEVQEVELK